MNEMKNIEKFWKTIKLDGKDILCLFTPNGGTFEIPGWFEVTVRFDINSTPIHFHMQRKESEDTKNLVGKYIMNDEGKCVMHFEIIDGTVPVDKTNLIKSIEHLLSDALTEQYELLWRESGENGRKT